MATDPRDAELIREKVALRKKTRHPGEIPWLVVGGVLCLLAYAAGIAVLVASAFNADEGLTNDQTVVQGLALLGLSPVLILFVRGLQYAQMRANAVRMSPTQFPEGYRMVVEAARAAGLERVPDAYVVSGGGSINAFAAGHGFRRYVVVHSDLFEVGGAARDPDALRFVVGHEVGHLAAGHASYWRIVAMQVIRQVPILGLFLSRAQEYTADNYGYRFCPTGSGGAIRVLAGGKYLNANVDVHEFADRATFERGLFVWCANLAATHPILTWRAQALRDRSRPGHLFTVPRFQPAGAPSLPAGSDRTNSYPHPDEALAFLDAHPPLGAPQFGVNFPVPLPGHEVAAGPAYGQRTLSAGWQSAPASHAVDGGGDGAPTP